MIGVYQITFPGGEFYIGSAWGKYGISGRWTAHKTGSYSSPKYLQLLSLKYGGWQDNWFVVLRLATSKHRVLLWEQAYINKYKDNPLLLNRIKNIFKPGDMSGTNNPFYNKHHSEETKQKLRDRIVTTETRNKLRLSGLGRKASEETKRKQSTSHIGLSAGDRAHFVKLDWDKVRTIRRIYKPKEYSIYKLANEFGVTASTIYKIIINETWVEK